MHTVDLLLSLADGHPHRSQQLAYHSFRLASEEADEETVLLAKEAALDETTSEFQVMLDRMTPTARAVYLAVCKNPTTEIALQTLPRAPRHQEHRVAPKRHPHANRCW